LPGLSAHIGARHKVYGLVVLFLAYTGLRAGELAGLEVQDLDLTRGTVRVQRTKRKVRGGWETGTPKSRKSRRVVPLDGWLADDLRDYLQTHPNRGVPTAPLFPNRQRGGTPNRALDWSEPVEPGALYKNLFKPAVAAVGIAPTRLHDLRHTYAVLSLSAGAHYMQVSKWLGHESYVTTLTIYADYIDETEGGKAAPLARPVAPAPAPDNVVPLRPRTAG
jgi:integrase